MDGNMVEANTDTERGSSRLRFADDPMGRKLPHSDAINEDSGIFCDEVPGDASFREERRANRSSSDVAEAADAKTGR